VDDSRISLPNQYGPTTEKEVDKVRKFLIDQYCALEARREYKTLSHLSQHQWKSLLPYPWGRLPIRTVVQQETRSFPDLERRFLNRSVTSFQPPVMIGFLDSKLSLALQHGIYPPLRYPQLYYAEDFTYSLDEGYLRPRIFLELELSLVRSRPNYTSDTDFLPLLPFAALVSDIERFVESVNSAQSTHQGPGPLILAFQNVPVASPRFYSHEAGCRDPHIQRITRTGVIPP
jgi:hypothetical protein